MIDEQQEVIINSATLPTVQQPDLPMLPEQSVGAVALTREERSVLDRPAESERIAVRPDPLADGSAAIYLPHESYRDRLREAVGFGAFGLKTLRVWTEEKKKEKKTIVVVYVWGALYVRGSFVGDQIGSAEYDAENKRSDYSDAFKSAKSNCFVRCCSDGGLLTEAWNPAFRQKFIAEHCVKVTVNNDGKMQPKWRLKDAAPFDKEVAGSPPSERKIEIKPEPKAPPQVTPPAAAGLHDEREVNLNTEAPRASTEQVERLEELTANLNPEAVAAALKQRRAASFEELTAKQAQNIIEKLEGTTA